MTDKVRNAGVEELSVISADNTCVVEIGDCERLAPVTRALSVHRERAIFGTNEFAIGDFPGFTRPVPHPIAPERISIHRVQQEPHIRVGRIRIVAMSSSCIVQVGSSRDLVAESRIKHIRHLFRE